jgi:hypothetical protein
MSKNMLSLKEIDGQTALELPERALLSDTGATVTVTAGIAASSSSTSNASSTSGNNNIVVVDNNDHH